MVGVCLKTGGDIKGVPVTPAKRACEGIVRRAASRSRVLVAVGIRIIAHPRTEPDVPHSGIRHPPRVGDGEALLGPRMSDARWKPFGDESIDRRPGGAVLLAAPAEAPPPQSADAAANGARRLDVVGHDMSRSTHCADPARVRFFHTLVGKYYSILVNEMILPQIYHFNTVRCCKVLTKCHNLFQILRDLRKGRK